MRKKLVTAADGYPVTIDEAKGHIVQKAPDDDAYVENILIPAASKMVEDEISRALLPQTWDFFFDEFPDSDSYLELGLPPTIDVVSVKYYDSTGGLVTLDTSTYYADDISEPGRIYLQDGATWPATQNRKNAIAIRCEVGYGDAAAVPPIVKLAILQLVSHFYENREPVALISGAQPYEMPIKIVDMLSPYKTDWI